MMLPRPRLASCAAAIGLAAVLSLLLPTGHNVAAAADRADEAAAALDACRFREAKTLIEGLPKSARRSELVSLFRDAVKRETETQNLYREGRAQLSASEFRAALDTFQAARRNTACKGYAATIDKAAAEVRGRWSQALQETLSAAVGVCDFKAAAGHVEDMRRLQLPGADAARADFVAAYEREKATFDLWERARELRRQGQPDASLLPLLEAGFATHCASYGRRIAAALTQTVPDLPVPEAVAVAWPGIWQGKLVLDRVFLGDEPRTVGAVREQMSEALGAYRGAIETDMGGGLSDFEPMSPELMVELFRLALATSAADIVGAYLAAAESGVPVAVSVTADEMGLRLGVPPSVDSRNDAQVLLRPLQRMPALRPLKGGGHFAHAELGSGLFLTVRLGQPDKGAADLAIAIGIASEPAGLPALLGLEELWLVLSGTLREEELDWPELASRLDELTEKSRAPATAD